MSSYAILGGSHRGHPANSVFAGQPSPQQLIHVTCILKRKAQPIGFPQSRLNHAELDQMHGADPSDIEAIEHFAAEHDLCVTSIDSAARSVQLMGPLSSLAAIFGAEMELRLMGEFVFRTRSGQLRLPESLAGRVVGVFGFDERPVATTRHRVANHSSKPVSYSPIQVAQAYNFPKAKGVHQTIALIELGGGFKKSDLTAYWKELGLPNVTATAISVDRAPNHPIGNPNSADGEVALDIEVAGAVAPSAHIAVYFAPNTDQGFYNAISKAIHDKLRKPSVISISWGGPESSWTPQALDAFNALFHDAALLGISVTAAAGDSGSSDGNADGVNHVDFPASSPWVLACGGTRLVANSGKIQQETVWNEGADGGATGGGVSSYFAKPIYQSTLSISGRGVPDVAGNADPQTGYLVRVDGAEGAIGGTSAVAPLWAGLIALLNEQLGKNVGWLHPKLYAAPPQSHALRDITSGDNGAYKASTGWDSCAGLGSPDGQALLTLLKNQH